jgi:hypothetical protein
VDGGQTAAGDRYEIVAVAIGEDRRLEEAVRPLLRDQDRWIEAPGLDEYEAFNTGAGQAQGEYVFLTEAHCIPDRDCMTLTLEELDRTNAPGVRARSVPDTVVHSGPWRWRPSRRLSGPRRRTPGTGGAC